MLFDFAEFVSPHQFRFGECKTYPDDSRWPSDSIWELFNDLLGGALVKTVPYAAPCYQSFGMYDVDRCDFLTRTWFNGSEYQ